MIPNHRGIKARPLTRERLTFLALASQRGDNPDHRFCSDVFVLPSRFLVHSSTRLISGPLQTERQSDGRRRLLRDLVVEVDGMEVSVPAGAVTDYSSIPALGRILVRWSKVDIAGVVHDWLYRTAPISRARADSIWRLVALAGDHRANMFQAWVGWIGLRVGGWYAWSQHRNHGASPQDR